MLLHTAEAYTLAKEGAVIGLKAGNVSVDWDGLMARKRAVVDTLVAGVGTLMASNGITVVRGTASFLSPRELSVALSEGGTRIVRADSVIISTGSEPVVPPIPGFELDGVITKHRTLSLEKLPNRSFLWARSYRHGVCLPFLQLRREGYGGGNASRDTSHA